FAASIGRLENSRLSFTCSVPCGKGDTPLFRAIPLAGVRAKFTDGHYGSRLGTVSKCFRHSKDYCCLRSFSSPVAPPSGERSQHFFQQSTQPNQSLASNSDT